MDSLETQVNSFLYHVGRGYEISPDTGWIYVTTVAPDDDDDATPFDGDWFRRLVVDKDGKTMGLLAIVNPDNPDHMILAPRTLDNVDIDAQLMGPPLPDQEEWNARFASVESKWGPNSL